MDRLLRCLLVLSAVAEATNHASFVWFPTNGLPRSPILSHRQLQSNDFAELNAILQRAILNIAGGSVSEGLVLDATIQDVECRNAQIEDASVDSIPSKEYVQLNLSVVGVSTQCKFRYSYRTLLFRGSGEGSVSLRGDRASIGWRVKSDDSSTAGAPPSRALVVSCSASIAIESLSFEKGLLGLAPVETLLRRILQSRSEGAICNALSESKFLQDALQQFNALLAPYRNGSVVDPLSAEQAGSSNYFNFQSDATTKEGKFVRWILDEASSFLSATNGNSTSSMRINELLRNQVLEQDGSISINDIPWEGISARDRLTQTTLELNSVRLVGLDSLTSLQPLQIVGRHTLQTSLSFETLSIVLDATVTIRPSRANNAYITVPGPPAPPVVENIQIFITWNDVDATASLFLPVEQQPDLMLGSLLHMDHIAPCLLSLLGESSPLLTSLSLSFQDVRPPTLRGFVSKGIDRVVSNLSVAFVQMYKETLLEILPNVFQDKIRPAVNAAIRERLLEQSRDCPAPAAERGSTLDLLALVQAEGSPYGDVLPSLYATWQERFVISNENGVPRINEALILPITEAQSGIAGQLHFTEEALVDYDWADSKFPTLADRVQLRVSSPRVEHLDSVVTPLQLLEIEDATTLRNSVRLGTQGGQQLTLNSEIRYLVESEGGESPLVADNTFGIGVSFETTVNAVIVASIKEGDFTTFRMSNVLNPFCWLDIFEKDAKDSLQLSLTNFDVALNVTDVSLECWYCTSLEGDILPEVMDTVRSSEILSYCETMIERSLEEVGRTYGDLVMDHLGKEQSEQKCPDPSSPSADVSLRPFILPQFPLLSAQSVNSLIFAGMLGMQTLMIVTAKAHLHRHAETDYLPASLPSLAKPGIVDWMDLNSTIGTWASSALGQFQNLTKSMKETEFGYEPGFNELVRGVMDEQRRFRFPGGRIEFSVMNTSFVLDSILVAGLDTTSDIALLEAVAPHRITTRAAMSHLDVVVSITAHTSDHPDGVPLEIAASLSEVAFEAESLLEIDWNELGIVEIGSIAHLRKIVPCVVSNIGAFAVERLAFDVQNISAPTIKGVTDKLANDALKSLNEHLFKEFSKDIHEAIPIILNTTVRNSANAILNELRINGDDFCSYDAAKQGVVDFRDLLVDKHEAIELGGNGDERYGSTFSRLLTVVRNKFSSDDQNGGLNEAFIRPLTAKQSQSAGTIDLKGALVDYHGSAAVSEWEFEYSFKLSNVKIENLDSVGSPIALLQPVAGEAFSMNNSISLGTNSKSVLLTADVYVQLFDKQGNLIENDVTVALSIKDLSLVTILSFQVSESLFFQTPLVHLLNGVDCWIAPVLITPDSPTLDYSFQAEDANLTISCNECKTSGFDELIQSLYDIGETSEEVETFISTAIDIADRFLSSTFLRDVFTSLVDGARLSCPSSPQFDPSKTEDLFVASPDIDFGFDPMKRDPKMKIFNIVSGGLLAFLLALQLVIRVSLQARRKQLRNALPEDRAILLQQYEDSIESQAQYVDEETNSMYKSTSIATRMRYGVPMVLTLDLILYVVAHFAPLSYVNVNANLAGDDIRIKRFIEFSFFQAAMRTYRSGGNEMALMIIVFSGIWPYLKILASLYLWFASPTKITVKQRGTILLWMEVLTKLSIVDIAMMMILVATMLLLVGGPNDSEEYTMPENLYSLTIVVVPQAGFYCILIAQRLNRVSSRVLLECQETIYAAAIKRYYERISYQKSDACHKTSSKSAVHQPRSSFHEILTKATENSSLSVSSSLHPSNDGSVQVLERVIAIDSNSEGQSPISADGDDGCRGSDQSTESSQPEVSSSLQPDDDNFPGVPNEADAESKPENIHARLSSSMYVQGFCNDALPTLVPWIQEEFVKMQWSFATGAAALAILCVLVLFIIGCVMAPSIAIDAKEILGVTLESGRSFNEVIETFNVYKLVCTVLLSSRFVLSSKADYIGLIILIAVAASTSLAIPLLQVVRAARRWFKTHSLSTTDVIATVAATENHRTPLVLWSPLLVYVVAFCMAIWQLGAVWAYVIHNFCHLSGLLFTALQYVGMIKEDERRVQCFREQASTVWSLLILFGSFTALLVTFVTEVSAQHKKSSDCESLRRNSTLLPTTPRSTGSYKKEHGCEPAC